MRRFLIFVIVAVGLGTGAWWIFESQRRPPSDLQARVATPNSSAAQADEPAVEQRAVLALGTLEPKLGVVQVGSPLVGSRIQSVAVREGDTVSAGQVLVRLDSAAATARRDLVAAQLAEARERQTAEIAGAREQVAAAELALTQLEQGRPLELELQQAAAEVTRSKARQAEQELKRVTELRQLPEPLISEPQVEQQRLLLEAAQADLRAAEVGVRRLEQSLDFRKQQAEAELRAAEQALTLAEKGLGLKTLEQQLEIAELQLAETRIAASAAALVLNVGAHPGELVAQQPLVQLADIEQLACIAEIEAADAARISSGQTAHIRSRALGDVVLQGSVERIGNLVAAARLRPLDPRQPLDRSVVKVVIDIPPDEVRRLANAFAAEHRGALVGLQVEVELPLP